ncbi:MAG: hypothetical protein LRY69_01955 [Gammaproteobacteria bacterium]|nr:hypothetical protein [Gammaproteobacteria bacterium]
MINPADKVDQESIWIEETQNQLKTSEDEQQRLQHQLETLSKQNETSTQSQTDLQHQVEMLTQEITSMKKQIDDAKKQTEAQGVNAGGYPNQANSRSARMFPGNSKNNQMPYQPNVMNHVHAEYVDIAAEEAVDEKTTENFVPSGTFAKAVLLSGADASAAVNSQTNPDPMLFRIVDNGTLPNDATSHLKDCLLTSAVTGDISSERGKIRFERMSCTKEDGSVLEVPVEGYVAGADGKNGIRGIPVWREGALTERAFIAGTLSGFSDAVQSQYVTTSTSALGSTETVNDGDSVRYGVANGFSSASDRLAKYYIQRAEQYHPVIQIGPGVVVDVVFLKGFYIDGVEHTGKSKAQARPVRTQQQMHTEAQQAATNLLSNLSQNPNR